MKSLYYTTKRDGIGETASVKRETAKGRTYEYMTVLHSQGSAEPFGGAT